ncbi:MAG: DUF4465 domain-containing protein [Bacteroidales bacterium]|nr:DUF4465 domain-containing protein [Bacteroidales bacterium]
MKKIIGLMAFAVLCTACFKGAYYEANFTGVAGFNYAYDPKNFPDSVYINTLADSSTGLQFLANIDENTGEFFGGFVISMKRDSSLVVADDNKYPDFTVYTNPLSTSTGSVVDGCAVFYDSARKPEHGAVFSMASKGTCTPVYCMVTNTQPVVKYFLDEGSAAKDNDEYLNLTITGYLNGSKTGEAKYCLASKDSVNVAWKTVSLSKLGNIDAIDFHLETSGDGVPRYFCLDNLVAKIHIKEE